MKNLVLLIIKQGHLNRDSKQRYFLTLLKAFYEFNKGWSRRTAGGVSSPLIELIKPQNIIDVGCGTCTLLAAFRNRAVNDLLGIDGDYVESTYWKFRKSNLCPLTFHFPCRMAALFLRQHKLRGNAACKHGGEPG